MLHIASIIVSVSQAQDMASLCLVMRIITAERLDDFSFKPHMRQALQARLFQSSQCQGVSDWLPKFAQTQTQNYAETRTTHTDFDIEHTPTPFAALFKHTGMEAQEGRGDFSELRIM